LQEKSVHIDIYSDNICPWCYIGKKNLDKALADLALESLEVRWHAFQLYPQIPAGGVPRKEFMRARFGSSGGSAFERIREVGQEAGIAFAFDKLDIIPNTFDSHRLLEYAAEQGVQHATVELLMAAGFEQGRDIGSRDVLLEIAASAGLDAEETRAVLNSPRFVDEVNESLQWCAQAGISGVPFFRLDNGEVIQGAQPVPIFRMALESAA
jgi:predicted DsbA family dithiol-disulfide isomerase